MIAILGAISECAEMGWREVGGVKTAGAEDDECECGRARGVYIWRRYWSRTALVEGWVIAHRKEGEGSHDVPMISDCREEPGRQAHWL